MPGDNIDLTKIIAAVGKIIVYRLLFQSLTDRRVWRFDCDPMLLVRPRIRCEIVRSYTRPEESRTKRNEKKIISPIATRLFFTLWGGGWRFANFNSLRENTLYTSFPRPERLTRVKQNSSWDERFLKTLHNIPSRYNPCSNSHSNRIPLNSY